MEWTMAELKKVTMNLTMKDVANAEHILRMTGARNKAHAMSIALTLAGFIVRYIQEHPNGEILLRSGRDVQRVVMPELEQVAMHNQNTG